MEWGTVGGGKREWGGGGQFTSNLRPEWTGIAPHTKEGFQVSERDSGTRESRQAMGKLTRELSRGFGKGFVSCALILSTCIYSMYHAIVCMWLIKELCLGYK